MSFWKSFTQQLSSRQSKRRRRRPPRSGRLRLESLESRRVFNATALEVCDYEPLAEETSAIEALAADISADQQESTSPSADSVDPVLMVIANQDFWYQDYADTRAALETNGLEVVVAATTTAVAQPHAGSGQGGGDGTVTPDIALADVDPADYSAIAFVGGWGMAQYQYGFEGTYHNSSYQGDASTKQIVNDLVNTFIDQDKHVAAVCYGVSVLAYARVDGESLLAGREVAGWHGAAPSSNTGSNTAPVQIESNGADLLPSGSIGNPMTSTDDVFIDGKIITAENMHSAHAFGETLAAELIAAQQAKEHAAQEEQSEPLPVLMVIANQDFYHREYYETRESLEAAGLEVIVAAATTETATPHAISVVDGREPNVTPDLALSDVNAEDYSSIVFVGGYGAASYQYASDVIYDNPAYRGTESTQAVVNDLINAFVAQDKYVTAICNGVSILAWARVDGVSPLAGRTVSAWAHFLPSADGGVPQVTRDHIEANGAMQVLSGSLGDPTTATDDVYVDGKIITAENYDSAYQFGHVIAERLLAE